MLVYSILLIYKVYEDIFDAKNACEHLSGFNVMGRYLIVLYHSAAKLERKKDLEKQEAELKEIRKKFNVD